jgi:hypothetical protein
MHGRSLGVTALVFVATLGGCVANSAPVSPGLPTLTPGPSVAAPTSGSSPRILPSAVPSRPAEPAASGPPAEPSALRVDSFAAVVSQGLRVRTKPFVGATSRKLEPLLWDGAVVFVIAGPVAGSGYAWYLVKPLGEVDVQLHPDPPAVGWVAAGSHDGEPWLVPAASDCADNPLGWLESELQARPIGLDALSCFGDRSLTFRAWLSVAPGDGCRGTTGPWSISPAWLGPCARPSYRLADPSAKVSDEMLSLSIWIAPGVDTSALPKIDAAHWLLVDVVGQYAHPGAASCRATPTGGDGESPPIPELVVLDCRAQFVVTAVTAHADT